ncbi:hypothetical protein Pcinc_033429 [Petrolisthes cinctipes]|uniref:Uncharacterized protein n=1 Tax=Petrolisthes cinctipes TaxID=88211 RepID=A0AAE1ESG0_PETCI|nr:hypothetical protein Pcinc_033429 [Petrolisthes cinctipes]
MSSQLNVNVDEKLRGSCTLADYQLQAVTVVPRDYHAPPLSVTDLLTMSAISNHHHGNHHSSTDGSKKRGGLLSLFTRKPKSSTGGSSLSSGSAGERSISPARSDHYIDPHNEPPPSLHDPPPPLQHSNEPPPTLRHSSSTSQLPRPLSMHSTSAPPQPHPQPQRPLSVVIPPRTRKRQAPPPPPPPPVHSNGKDVSEVRSESVTSIHIQRSPQTSPAGSEVAGVTTNLTSVISTSSLSLASSRGKRKAPAPPQPPQPRPEPQPPIPEEFEPPGPRSSTPDTPTVGVNGTPQTDQSGLQDETKVNPISEPQGSSNSECEPRVNSPSPVEAPDIQQDPKTQRTSSPTSSVSSLSSADPTPAPTSPLLPQPDPPHASELTNLNTSHLPHHPASSFPPASSTGESVVPPARNTKTFSATPTSWHEAAFVLTSSTDSQTSASLYLDRLDELGEYQELPQDHTGHLFSSSTTPVISKFETHGTGGEDGAPNPVTKIYNNTRKPILPQGSNDGDKSVIPTFRVVTKSPIAVQQDEEIKKFVADGRTQKVTDENRFGSGGRSGMSGMLNSFARGELTRQENVMSDDDLDFNEDMFEPRNGSEDSYLSVSLSTDDNIPVKKMHTFSSEQSPQAMSTPIHKTAPQPYPRKIIPVAVRRSQSGNTMPQQHNTVKPAVLPKPGVLRKRAPPVPSSHPKQMLPPEADTSVISVSLDKPTIAGISTISDNKTFTSTNDLALNTSLSMKSKEAFVSSQESYILEPDEFAKIMQTQPDEDFKVHISKLTQIDSDMLSLLSEEGVDSEPYMSRRSSMAFNTDTSSEVDLITFDEHDNNTLKINRTSSAPTPKPSSSAVDVDPLQPGSPVPSTSSDRSGKKAMFSGLRSWGNTESLHIIGAESSDSMMIESHRVGHRKKWGSSTSPLSKLRLASDSSLCSDTGLHDGWFLCGCQGLGARMLRYQLKTQEHQSDIIVMHSLSQFLSHAPLSSLAWTTDHEVQTRTASFSSETSEERADVGGDEKETRGEDEKTSLVSEKEKRSEERDEKESEKSWGNRSEEREEEKSSDISEEQIIEKGIAMLDSVLRTASDEMEGESDTSNSEDETHENKRKESERREKESLLSTEQNSISSSSVTDLEGDVRIREDREKRIEKEEKEQNINEPPIPPMRRDRSPYNKIQSQDKTTTPLIRKSSVSSVSSGDSSTRTARSQNSKEAESHLQSVLLQSDEKNISKQTQEQLVQETTTTDLDDNNITTEITWDYKLPDPPTPFQDRPTSKYTDNASSLSSETTAESISTQPVPQVLMEELPTIQPKDSTVRESMNSQPESVNNVTNEVRKPALVRKEPERKGKDVVDSTSSASSRKSSFSSISSSSFQSDDQAKQRVINELKSAIKEVCSNEPRIVEMTPKTKGMETIMVMNRPTDTQKTYIAQPKPDSPSLGKDMSVIDRVTPAPTTSPEVEEDRVSESLPTRVKMPVQHTFIPRVVARVPPDPNIKPFIVKSKSIDSDSSYDSYTTTPDVDDSVRSRSESNTSYESAPPPLPDAPIPIDSDLEVRGSRSSSDVSDGGKTRADSSLDIRKLKMAARSSIQNVSSGVKDTSSSDESRSKSSLRRQDSDSSLEYNRSRVMNFSISTYKSRAEETSYEKKIVKSDSFSQSSGVPSVAQSTFLARKAVFGKPIVPSKSSMYRMHSESSLPTVGHSVNRVNSLSERLGGLRGKGQFQVPDPPRPLRRTQRLDHQATIGQNLLHGEPVHTRV